MSDNTAQRARLIGLISGLVVMVAIGVALVVCLGFGQSLTPLQQLSLLLAVAALWLVHRPLRFRGRYRSRRLAAARKITESFKSKKIVSLS
jgi:uncharacterized membrane protein